MRYGFARKVDANHGEIGDTFRKCGFLTLDLSRLGFGKPDWLVKRGGFWMLIEVKSKQGKLTPEQKEFSEDWPVLEIRTVEEVYALSKRVQ